jgi:hypothetical protein
MRTALLTYLKANLSGSITAATELPWAQGDNPLYITNKRRVYLDEPTTKQTPVIQVLDGPDIMETVTTVTGYLAVDAKNRPIDLDSALATLRVAKDLSSIDASFRKEFDYGATIDRDVVTYTFEYRFYTIN